MTHGPKNDRGLKAHLTKDGYIVKYRVGPNDWRPKRVPKDIRTEPAAIAYVEAWLAAQREANTPADTPTLKSLEAKWLAYREGKVAIGELAPSTVRADHYNLKGHIIDALGAVPLTSSDFTPPILRAFVRKLKAARAVNTTRNVVNTLTIFLHDALAEGWVSLPANPMEHPHVREEVPIARTKAGRGVIIHLALDQLAKVVACAGIDEAWRLRYLLGGLTGLDDGELSGLQWGDVDLESEVPSVRVKRAFRLTGSVQKGGKGGRPALGAPKRESRYRVVPLHREAVRALRAWKASGCEILLTHKPLANEPVFPSPSTGKHWRPRSAFMLRAHLERLGLPAKYEEHPITFKALRRSFATYLAAVQVPRERRERLMGHAPDSVGEEHYTHAELRMLYDDVNRIRIDLAGERAVQLPLVSG